MLRSAISRGSAGVVDTFCSFVGCTALSSIRTQETGRPSLRAGRAQHLTFSRSIHISRRPRSNQMLRLRTPFRTLQRQLHTTRPSTLANLGLRAESRLRTWEQRAPLSPEAVKSLVEEGASVYVEASEKRVWRDAAFSGVRQTRREMPMGGESERPVLVSKTHELTLQLLHIQAGATIVNKLHEVSPQVVLGIKEIPIAELAPETTYAVFNHVHKGQRNNLPLLSAMLESKSRFIDWELLGDTSSSGQFQRTTAFGWYAGFAAAADGLQGLGTKLLASCGVSSPLLSLQRPHQATGGVEEIVKKLKEVGEQWRAEGGRQGLGGPLTLVISGRGRVGKGAESAFDHLGVEWVTTEELRKITADKSEWGNPCSSISFTDSLSCRRRREQDLCGSVRTQGLAQEQGGQGVRPRGIPSAPRPVRIVLRQGCESFAAIKSK